MSYHIRNHGGCAEAVIDDNCGISTFYAIANTLAEELRVIFLGQQDEADSIDWEFQYKNNQLILHYDIFNGVSISTAAVSQTNDNTDLIREVASYLSSRSF